MKKLLTIFAVLMCLGISITAYAQDAPEADINADNRPAPVKSEPIEADNNAISEDVNEPRLADGVAGRGTIDAPDKYWAANGYPDNISFAFEAGGEMLNDGTSVAYWEIGIVNADEENKQEIIDLLSPSCRITFSDCTFSYRQREAAFNEIYASRNDIVCDVQMILNGETILVEIADGYEKEYAQKYVERYGWFVEVTTNDISAAKYYAQKDVEQYGWFVEGTNDVSATDDAIAGLGMDMGGNKNNPFGSWVLPVCLILLVGMATAVFFNRNRFVPAMQANNGDVVTENAPVSTKQTVAAIKNSALTPSDDVFKSIMEKVNNEKK
jgi:hypothetical protein